MEQKLFKESGVGSIAWYVQQFKNNPDRRGYTYIRKENKSVPQADELKKIVDFLVNSRYLDRKSKPDQPKSDRYTVTSFGHRYLEQHKDAINAAANMAADKDRLVATTRVETPVERESEETRPTEPIEKVSDLLGKPFHPGKAPEFVPSIPETPEQRKKIMGLDLRRGKNLLPGGEPMGSRDEDGPDTAFDDIRTPKVRAVAQDMPEPTAEPQPGDEYEPEADGPAVEDRGDSADLVTTLKQISGEILFDRHAKEVTVVDLIDRIEKNNDR